MKIFKELKIDNLPLNSEERIMEEALVLKWFREKYDLHSYIDQWKLTISLFSRFN